jgi:hypothetical protein
VGLYKGPGPVRTPATAPSGGKTFRLGVEVLCPPSSLRAPQNGASASAPVPARPAPLFPSARPALLLPARPAPLFPPALPRGESRVSKSNRGHVNIFQDFFINLIFFKHEKMIGNFLKVLNFNRLFFKLNQIIFKRYVAHIHLTFKFQKVNIYVHFHFHFHFHLVNTHFIGIIFSYCIVH